MLTAIVLSAHLFAANVPTPTLVEPARWVKSYSRSRPNTGRVFKSRRVQGHYRSR